MSLSKNNGISEIVNVLKNMKFFMSFINHYEVKAYGEVENTSARS